MDLLNSTRWMLVVGVLALFAPVSSVRAQLSPGPLHQSHEALEGLSRCTQCHALGKGVERERCLSCHEPLRLRIEAGQGLHARADYDECTKCHSDHQGREYEMIRWPGEQKDFPHADVGYELRLAHAKIECRDCHKAKNVTMNRAGLTDHGKDLDTTFLGLDTPCQSCHEDKHQNTVGTDCTRCHDESVWKPAPLFDHAKTEYPLVGKHADVPCQKCHEESPRFPARAFAACTDCHKDPHAGDLGNDCARCHDLNGWKEIKTRDFDHSKTKFPLVGVHRNVTCARCHVSGSSITGKLLCDQCHVDVHRGTLAQAGANRTDCSRCHNSERFVPSTYGLADHGKSRYPLTGAHLAVPCADCHGNGAGLEGAATVTLASTHLNDANNVDATNYVFPRLGCDGCHADPHGASFAKAVASPEPCAVCHVTDAWTAVTFSHEVTRYPLEGRHANASCADCHSSLVRQTVGNWDRETLLPMLPTLAATTGGQTPFEETATCVDFREHATTVRGSMREFARQTRADQAYDVILGSGRQGAQNQRAGRTKGKSTLRLDDAPVACAECHYDPHGEQFAYILEEMPREDGVDLNAALCARCHDQQNWNAGRFDHERDARFSLKGAHEKVTCGECHRREPDGRQRFRPLGMECRDCHATTPRTDQ